ncbi:MAG: UTP--glucose-1-phosphate uridylyltransferase GalU [Myxococcota bacterium]
MNKKVKKAVIPVAGFGTRLLPVTKSVPKELLPIVDVPAIQVIVQECIDSGIEEVIFITARGKAGIVDHFDYNFELEQILAQSGKIEALASVRNISSMIRSMAVRQKEPLGLGHAVLCARGIIGDEPFLVLLPDDIISAQVPAARQLLDVYDQYGQGVVALMEVPRDEVSRYGIVAGESWQPGYHRIRTLVEKPDETFAPSNLAIIGRYLLPGVIFEYLEETSHGQDGEIQLTDALARLARERALIGYEFEGERHDIGDKLGFLTANIAYGLKRPDMAPKLRRMLRSSLAEEE